MGQSEKTPPAGAFPWKEILGFLGVVLAAYLGYLGIRSQNEIPIRATQTAQAELTALANMPNTASLPELSLEDLELTVMAMEIKLTQEAGATATQQYLNVVQTVQANATATSLYEQVVAEQTQNVEATAQAIISTQQTATAIANNQKLEQLISFAEQASNLPPSFYDSFENNGNNWSPKNYNDYSISLKGDVLTTKLKNPSISPLILTCEKCNSFNNFSYQVDIKTPGGIPRVVSGIVFGSSSRLDQQPLQDYYMLSIYSSGDLILERVSSTGRDIVKVWEHRQDLLTPDGQFHTLQVVTIDNFAAVYLDGKSVGDVFALEYSAQGYIGIVVESSDVDVIFDNLKVVLLP